MKASTILTALLLLLAPSIICSTDTSPNHLGVTYDYYYGWFRWLDLKTATTTLDKRMPQFPYWSGNFFESDTTDYQDKKIYALMVKRPITRAINATIFEIDLKEGKYTLYPTKPGHYFTDVPNRIFYNQEKLVAVGCDDDEGTIFHAVADLETGELNEKKVYPFYTKNYTHDNTFGYDSTNQVLIGIHTEALSALTGKVIAIDLKTSKVLFAMDFPANTSIPVLHYSPSRGAFFGFQGYSTGYKSKIWTPIMLKYDLDAKKLVIKKGKELQFSHESGLDKKNTAFDEPTGSLAQFFGFFDGYPYTSVVSVDVETMEDVINVTYSQYPGYIFSGQSLYTN